MQNRLSDVNKMQLDPTPLVFGDRISILPILFNFADRIHELIKSLPLSIFQSPTKGKALSTNNCFNSQYVDQFITQQKTCSMGREEVRFVMEKLEVFWSKEGDDDEEIGDEIRGMFEENEPSFEELKQTFNVFDRNRDGFIDEHELFIVLSLLESNKGIFIHDCKRMIARFDLNNDGKIDFNEFVKFMEVALA